MEKIIASQMLAKVPARKLSKMTSKQRYLTIHRRNRLHNIKVFALMFLFIGLLIIGENI